MQLGPVSLSVPLLFSAASHVWVGMRAGRKANEETLS